MTAKETAAAIRTELKTAGYSRNAVSVTVSGGSVNITIKSANVKRAPVKVIATKYERIDHCHVTHEILCGANTFVFIRIDEALMSARMAEIRAAAEAAGLVTKGWARFGFNGVQYEVQGDKRICALVWGGETGSRIGSPYMYNLDEAFAAMASHSFGDDLQ